MANNLWIKCRTKNAAFADFAPWYLVNLDHVVVITRGVDAAGWWLIDIKGEEHIVLRDDNAVIDELFRP